MIKLLKLFPICDDWEDDFDDFDWESYDTPILGKS